MRRLPFSFQSEGKGRHVMALPMMNFQRLAAERASLFVFCEEKKHETTARTTLHLRGQDPLNS